MWVDNIILICLLKLLQTRSTIGWMEQDSLLYVTLWLSDTFSSMCTACSSTQHNETQLLCMCKTSLFATVCLLQPRPFQSSWTFGMVSTWPHVYFNIYRYWPFSHPVMHCHIVWPHLSNSQPSIRSWDSLAAHFCTATQHQVCHLFFKLDKTIKSWFCSQ
jgi:hypothetical protein